MTEDSERERMANEWAAAVARAKATIAANIIEIQKGAA